MVVVASVSCIYGLGVPELYEASSLDLILGMVRAAPHAPVRGVRGCGERGLGGRGEGGTSIVVSGLFDESEDVVFGADFKASEKTFPTLERLCEIALAKTVDAHNISDVLAYAEAFNCEMLATYCKDFLFMNLDAVLAATRPRERSIMMYQTSVGMIGSENEEQVFDFNEEFLSFMDFNPL